MQTILTVMLTLKGTLFRIKRFNVEKGIKHRGDNKLS